LETKEGGKEQENSNKTDDLKIIVDITYPNIKIDIID